MNPWANLGDPFGGMPFSYQSDELAELGSLVLE
jgi:hypothetical protein